MNRAFLVNHAGTGRCFQRAVGAFTPAAVSSAEESAVENNVKRHAVARHW
jgi:hypothetical protein